MKLKPLLGLCALAAGALAPSASADEILIYKTTSTRPWTKYECYRPDSTDPAAPAIPSTPRVGSVVETRYWVYNHTANKAFRFDYYSFLDRGAKVKEYTRVGDLDFSSDTGEPGRDARYLKAKAANTFNHCISGGGSYESDADENSDGENDRIRDGYEFHLTGAAKPFIVVPATKTTPATTIQQVALSLTGNYLEFNDESYTKSSPKIYYRSLDVQTGTFTMTLDATLTKAANSGADIVPPAGGAPISNSSVEYGLALVEKALLALGYDKYEGP